MPSRRTYHPRVKCVICPGTFVSVPHSRAVTCSPSCATRLGNLDRGPHNCWHCAMVESYHLARNADIRAIEVAGGDDTRRPLIFKAMLGGRGYGKRR